MKKLWRFLKSRLFLINFGLAIIITIVLVWLSLFGLKLYTKHGTSVSIPDFIGLSIEQVESICKEKGFKFVVNDSVYSKEVDKGAVVDQNPSVGFKVKEGRTIYLIVNAMSDELVEMPDLKGVSLRQAVAIMETYGLVAGNLKYVPDIAQNTVIRQLYQGKEIEQGQKIKKDSKIDLVLGLGLSGETTKVPRLLGKTYKNAYELLLDKYLNIGAVTYDSSVKTRADSINAKVYRQSPVADTINNIKLGSNIDIWLSANEALFTDDKEEFDE
ncbi:MAG: PASTA domain-containing protein [Bacteroidales bacterium]|nr:PASTA domain-containing protein [Bacteroidales bacterium]